MKETNVSKPQHIILMEYCEGGHALDVCNKLAAAGKQFDLSTLIIAFGQICNAVSYLHAQRPPIVHRDLKPVNFLVKNGAYKLCDFGSAVFGHVDLRTPKARADAEEVVEKTTTQMFRAPEMVDLYSAKRLTQATDVWALGACLFSLAFLQNCFEEGSNLAILSRKYKIPEDNPYGDGLVELLDRMLTVDPKGRSDMTEVILCLSAVYSGRPLPPKKKPSKSKKDEKEGDEVKKSSSKGEKGTSDGSKDKTSKKKKDGKITSERAGTFRTDGQGIYDDGLGPSDKKEVKKLNPNSAAARRRQAAGGAVSNGQSQPAAADAEFTAFNEQFDSADQSKIVNHENDFSTDANPFAGVTSETGDTKVAAAGDGSDAFRVFDNGGNNTPGTDNAFADFDGEWGDVGPDKNVRSQSVPSDSFSKFDPTTDGASANRSDRSPPRRVASSSKSGEKGEKSRARKPRRKSTSTSTDTSGTVAVTEGLDGSFSEMNVSNPDSDGRKPRRERAEGDKRQVQRKSSGKARRPKEGEEGEKSAPRRNRSSTRDSARASS